MAKRARRARALERVLLGVIPLILIVAGTASGQAAELAAALGNALIGAIQLPLPGPERGVRVLALEPLAVAGMPLPATDLLYAPFARHAPAWLQRPVRTLELDDTAGLSGEFERLGYSLAAGEGRALAVPRIILATLPPDFRAADASDQRKTMFFQLLLPLALQVNESILDERRRLLALRAHRERGEGLTPGEHAWLARLAGDYGATGDDLDELLRRVDIIPPSLALAQAALESGWGTSAYARTANALFGQYMPDERSRRPAEAGKRAGSAHIRPFERLLDAVGAYARNLNTSVAYRKFRAARAAERHAGAHLNGYQLAGLIQRYSERGEPYVRDLRRVMRGNGLAALDDAWLSSGALTQVVFNDT
ncbi:MAG: glucosaminidase domain-containing protein [Alphaproteobacteria bacterium]